MTVRSNQLVAYRLYRTRADEHGDQRRQVRSARLGRRATAAIGRGPSSDERPGLRVEDSGGRPGTRYRGAVRDEVVYETGPRRDRWPFEQSAQARGTGKYGP
jgi:hypothetical protein